MVHDKSTAHMLMHDICNSDVHHIMMNFINVQCTCAFLKQKYWPKNKPGNAHNHVGRKVKIEKQKNTTNENEK